MKKPLFFVGSGMIILGLIMLIILLISFTITQSITNLNNIPHISHTSGLGQDLIIKGDKDKIFGGEIISTYCNLLDEGQLRSADVNIAGRNVFTLPTLSCDNSLSETINSFSLDPSLIPSNQVSWDIDAEVSSAQLSLFERVECTDNSHCTSFILQRTGTCTSVNICEWDADVELSTEEVRSMELNRTLVLLLTSITLIGIGTFLMRRSR